MPVHPHAVLEADLFRQTRARPSRLRPLNLHIPCSIRRVARGPAGIRCSAQRGFPGRGSAHPPEGSHPGTRGPAGAHPGLDGPSLLPARGAQVSGSCRLPRMARAGFAGGMWDCFRPPCVTIVVLPMVRAGRQSARRRPSIRPSGSPSCAAQSLEWSFQITRVRRAVHRSNPRDRRPVARSA